MRALLIGLMAASLAGTPAPQPFVLVLGIAQDGGVPQSGTPPGAQWSSSRRRLVVSLGLVDPRRGRWLFEATPDFKEQLHRLDQVAPAGSVPGLSGIFLTHAHTGHYTGLIHLGFEMMGAQGVPVFAMRRLRRFLASNAPWSQLVTRHNIVLRELEEGRAVALDAHLTVTPLPVPHRQEYSEVVGYRIQGPRRSVLFIPDIDSWEEWDNWGVHVEEEIARVDRAYLDGSFYAPGEVAGRDMSGFPHPTIRHSLERFAALPAAERRKIRFIHLNHTNPALREDSPARRAIRQAGLAVAREMERFGL